MSDTNLEEIRKARLQQLEQQGGSGGNAGAGGTDGAREEQQKQREAEARSNILAQILEPSAADRLNRIRLVKESRANDVENRLIMLARTGRLRQKITEDHLKEILGSLSEQQGQTREASSGGVGKIVVNRRKGWDDDDDDLLNDL